MNPYFTLLLDIVALLETPQFAQVMHDVQTIEGGSGTHLSSPGASDAVKVAIQTAGQNAKPVRPVSAPGGVSLGMSKLRGK